MPANQAAYVPRPLLALPEGTAHLHFADLGYARAAKASYLLFSQLKQAGVLPSACRFQVSLPTPLAPINAYILLRDQRLVESAYEAAMIREVQQITEAIPADELAIQWDTASEFALLEGVMPTFLRDVQTGIIQRLTQLGALVPEGVELGYHLCYGEPGADR